MHKFDIPQPLIPKVTPNTDEEALHSRKTTCAVSMVVIAQNSLREHIQHSSASELPTDQSHEVSELQAIKDKDVKTKASSGPLHHDEMANNL